MIGTRALDMVSDGKDFTLWIPSKNKAIKGSNSLSKKSANMMENIRPAFFFDAMVVRGLDPDDDYSVAADSETVEDASKKHLLFTPEYNLNIMRRKPGTHELTQRRTVTFIARICFPMSRICMTARATWRPTSPMRTTGRQAPIYTPGTITIKRPSDGFQIVITVESVQEDQPLKDDQFQARNSRRNRYPEPPMIAARLPS